tara:strand:- start:32 stop:901 length:870 start_codon:yes stop_codon:yes gene_type:complete
VINFIANECKTNIRGLIGILNRIITFGRIHKKILSISDCKNILKDVFSQTRVITVDKIQNTVSGFFNISLNEMLSQRRSRPLARPRQIAMYLSKKNKEINLVTEIKDSILNYNRLNPDLNFDNFVKGSSNEIALSSSKKICEQTSRYNPLYIYGGVGLGKTHLLNAIGLELKKKTNVMFISTERFMYHFIKSIKKNDMVNFKDFFRKSSVFIIDDIQFISGKEGLQEEFFHTFNSLLEKSSQIIVSADRPPMKLDRVQERIKSRLSGGLIVDIDNPDLDLKIKIIKKYN